jgi:hypothetical protein
MVTKKSSAGRSGERKKERKMRSRKIPVIGTVQRAESKQQSQIYPHK